MTGDEAIDGMVRARYYESQVHYTQLYMLLYSAYNAWYSAVAGTCSDRDALIVLKAKSAIWHSYLRGMVMRDLSLYVGYITEYTQRQPLGTASKYWAGSLGSSNDWRGLIEYWYQVRCRVVHGGVIDKRHIYLAYMSLSVFMRSLTSGELDAHTTAKAKGGLLAVAG